MQSNGHIRCCLIGGCTLLAALLGMENPAHQGAQTPPLPPGVTQEQFARMMEMMSTGAAHEQLKQFVGDWKAEARMWMSPDSEPELQQGMFHRQLVMDGRYVEGTYEAMWLGKPFKGRELLGYDNWAKKYTSIWFDNSATWPYFETGTCDAAGRLFTLTSENRDCCTGELVKTKSVITIVNPDQIHSDMFKVVDGKEIRLMEITCTRVKPGAA